MRVGIDISFIIKDRVGVDQYIYNLLRGLANVDSDNLYYLYSNRAVPEEFFCIGGNFKVVIHKSKILPRIMWVQFVLPGLLKRDGIELLHAPCYMAPSRARCPKVITFHDMASWLFPEKFRLIHRIVYSWFVPSFAKNADRIIAVSESTKKDLVRLFGMPEDKITVVYEGTNELFKPAKDAGLLERIREKYGLPEKYILYVGILEPRKNISALIRAYGLMKDSREVEHKLVIVGNKGWMCDEIFKTVQSLRLEDEVIFTGYIADKELPLVYNSAELFVYPSTYEGFGLPPLEAMACGVPVITSNISSLPEVTGDAAILINPDNADELSAAMAKVISSSSLRESMINKGFERVKMFSWKKAAEETLEVYKDILAGN